MNNKGNIPMTLLLVVAIALIISAWMAFLTFDKSFGNISDEHSKLISGIKFSENYIIGQAKIIAMEVISLNVSDELLKEKYQERALGHIIIIESEGNFFGKIRNGEFTFEKRGGQYFFEVKDVNVQSSFGYNKIRRVFDINLNFDSEDILLVTDSSQNSFTVTEPVFSDTLIVGEPVRFSLINEQHSITLESVNSEKIIFLFESEPISIIMYVGQKTKIDVDNDGYYDLEITLVSVNREANTAYIIRKNIHEIISPKDDKSSIDFAIRNTKPVTSIPEGLNNPFDKKFAFIDDLPEIKLLPEVSYDSDAPCGPSSLYDAFRQLGREINLCDIDQQRQGGFLRTFLSIFSEEAKDITWPSELVKIAKNYGYDVEVLKGKDATIENARAFSTENSAVILHVSLDKDKPLFTQHFELYDVEYLKRLRYSQQTGSFKSSSNSKGVSEDSLNFFANSNFEDPILADSLLREIYVIKKRA